VITAVVVGDEAVIARLNAMGPDLRRGLARAVTRLGFELQRKVQAEKLTGQVLRVRTGSLRSSIHTQVSAAGDQVAASVGTNIRYARIHEYGGTIPAHTVTPKSARALAFFWKGEQRFFRRVEIPAVTMPERSFLRSALREMTPRIEAGLKEAVAEALRK
jgi:HK97 gp10 family phage protein